MYFYSSLIICLSNLENIYKNIFWWGEEVSLGYGVRLKDLSIPPPLSPNPLVVGNFFWQSEK